MNNNNTQNMKRCRLNFQKKKKNIKSHFLLLFNKGIIIFIFNAFKKKT